jgi:hypothetical protein
MVFRVIMHMLQTFETCLEHYTVKSPQKDTEEPGISRMSRETGIEYREYDTERS